LITLVERDKDQNRVRELFGECLRGRGQVAVLSGAVGSGKTEMLDAFVQWAAGQPTTILTAACSRAEETLPLGVMNQLLSHADLPVRSSRRFRRLITDDTLFALVHRPESQFTEGNTTVALHEVGLALLELAKGAPLVMVIDDVQYADVASLRCLSHLIRRMRSARIFVLLSTCVGLQPLHSLPHAEVLRQPHTHRIRLNPLSHAGVSQLLEAQLDAPPTPSLTAAVHAASGGNPLMVEALIEDNRTSSRYSSAELVTGEALDQAVLGYLCRFEPSTTRVAQAVAVLRELATRTTVARLLDMEPEAVGRHLDWLEGAGLLLSGRYRHPRVRAAVLNGITAEKRAEMHGHAALLLHQEDTPALVVAQHLIAADDIDAHWVIPLLQEAADQALEGEDIDLALDCLRLAYKHCADGPQRTLIQSMLMRVEWWANPSVAMRHLDDLVAAVRTGQFRGSRAIMLIDHLLWQGRYADIVDVVRCLTADGPLDAETAPFLLPVRLSLYYAFPFMCSTLPNEDTAVAFDDRVPESDVHCGVSYILQRARLDDHTLSLSLTMLGALVRTDRLDGISLELADDESDGTSPTWRALACAVRAEAAYGRGDFDTALEQAQAALTLITPRSWGVFLGAPLATLLNAATAAGRSDLASRYAALSVPPEMLHTVMGVRYLHARGRFYLTECLPHEALTDFRACRDLMSSWRVDLPSIVPWWIDAARAYLRLGWRSQARELLHEQMARLGPDDTQFRGVTMRLLAATAEVGRRPALLREAVRELRGSGDREELAATFADLGHALHEVGDDDQARTMLRRAEQISTRRLGEAPPWIPHQDNVRTAITGYCEADSAADLSDAERRVAALAALGHTNREIASKLFVTVSTIEQHLTRVYRKLGVNGRSDLPPRLDLDLANHA
jgi:DNA-binding CsgD family transcriptional regulator/DNA-binding transcriptional ArsR family regulator